MAWSMETNRVGGRFKIDFDETCRRDSDEDGDPKSPVLAPYRCADGGRTGRSSAVSAAESKRFVRKLRATTIGSQGASRVQSISAVEGVVQFWPGVHSAAAAQAQVSVDPQATGRTAQR